MSEPALKLVFMGTPEFSVPALRALSKAGHEIVAVYTQPPRPAGRGYKEQVSAVQRCAEKLGLPVRAPVSLKSPDEQRAFADLNADVAVVVAYGLLLPMSVLEAPRYGCINIHASLLPRWRGAAPIQRAILAGDVETGITLMQMDEGLDTGPMLAKRHVPITPATTAEDLQDVLSDAGAEMITALLQEIAEGKTIVSKPQDEALATYAGKLHRDEGRIDWTRPATEILRQLRALTPWPGVWFMAGDQRIKLHEAEVVPDLSGPPGTVLDRYMTVACGTGALRLDAVQPQNKKTMPGAAYLNGAGINVGDRLS